MYDAEHPEPAGVRTPPYISFQTFLTMIDDLKTNGLPPRIDRSVLKRFSGGVGGQIQAALKSLGLTDEGNVPTDRLVRMVGSYGTEGFKPLLKECLAVGYPFLADFDLKNGTPSMFAEAFKKGTSAREDVLKKCRRFFIYAAQFCGLEIGTRLTAGAASPTARANASYKRRSATAKKVETPSATPPSAGASVPVQAAGNADPVQMLVSILDMTTMDEDEQAAVWTLIRHLKKKAAKAGGTA